MKEIDYKCCLNVWDIYTFGIWDTSDLTPCLYPCILSTLDRSIALWLPAPRLIRKAWSDAEEGLDGGLVPYISCIDHAMPASSNPSVLNHSPMIKHCSKDYYSIMLFGPDFSHFYITSHRSTNLPPDLRCFFPDKEPERARYKTCPFLDISSHRYALLLP